MGDVEILEALLEIGGKIGKIQQAHLYDGGIIRIEGAGFTLSFGRKEASHGRAQDVCQDDHRFRCLS